MRPMLLGTYDGVTPLDGWLCSVKFDGHRAIWTGARLLSRAGKPIAAPAWFLASLPSVALDGEIYCGTTDSDMLSIVLGGHDDPRWATVRYHVFDAPSVAGGKAARVAAVPALVAGSSVCVAVEHTPIDDAGEALARMRAVVAAGGEGVVVCHPDAPYIAGRSSRCLKIKPGEGDGARLASSAFARALA